MQQISNASSPVKSKKNLSDKYLKTFPHFRGLPHAAVNAECVHCHNSLKL